MEGRNNIERVCLNLNAMYKHHTRSKTKNIFPLCTISYVYLECMFAFDFLFIFAKFVKKKKNHNKPHVIKIITIENYYNFEIKKNIYYILII